MIYRPKPKNGNVTPDGEITYSIDGIYTVWDETYADFVYQGKSFSEAITAFQTYNISNKKFFNKKI